jgi:hypothetical protein
MSLYGALRDTRLGYARRRADLSTTRLVHAYRPSCSRLMHTPLHLVNMETPHLVTCCFACLAQGYAIRVFGRTCPREDAGH